MAVEIQRKLFTVAEYHQMIQAGVFREDDRIELLNGELMTMSPIGIKHMECVNQLTTLLVPRLTGRATVSIQNPIQVGQHSEPQPDVALLRPRSKRKALPPPDDVLLVIEVADTSVDYDRDEKIPAYGRAGIAEAWRVSLTDGWIEIYREPSPAGYRTLRKVLPDEQVSPQAFADVELDAGEILNS